MAAYLGNYLSAPQKQKEIEFDFSNLKINKYYFMILLLINLFV
jgi:hypothetical protein